MFIVGNIGLLDNEVYFIKFRRISLVYKLNF